MRWSIFPLLALLGTPAFAAEYYLVLDEQQVLIGGEERNVLAFNGQIPGPVLRFKEGEEAVIHVTNKMDEDSSVHWHGLLLPGEMDGVPGLNGFPGIRPGETFTYRFPIRQSGTYWYHPHSSLQEQEGLYGAMVIDPATPDPVQAEREYVIVLSDFTTEHPERILRNLKVDAGYYNRGQRTIGDFFKDADREGLSAAIQDRKEWGEMRMDPTDLADVSGYTHLVNGKTSEENWTALFNPGERVRLRIINASAMSFYDLRIPGLKMKVVQADGQNVQPVTVDEMRIGVAETYDVVVTPQDDRAYRFVAEPIDREGFALATLAPRPGMAGQEPEQRPRTILTMDDMGMSHSAHGGHGSVADDAAMDHAAMGHADLSDVPVAAPDGDALARGWADASTPPGHRALSYADLKPLSAQTDTRAPIKDIQLRLGGNMERYIWTINGKTHEEAEPIRVGYNERVRLTFTNDTMMAHPMHLHGMFMQLENGQPAASMPNKHTLIIPPGKSVSALLTASEAGEWAFHCHLLYHMAAGMMTALVVEPPSEQDRAASQPAMAAPVPHLHHQEPAQVTTAPTTSASKPLVKKAAAPAKKSAKATSSPKKPAAKKMAAPKSKAVPAPKAKAAPPPAMDHRGHDMHGGH